MAILNKFDCLPADLAHGVHHLDVDVLKVMLTAALPLRTQSVKADLTEIDVGNGYPAGGLVATS